MEQKTWIIELEKTSYMCSRESYDLESIDILKALTLDFPQERFIKYVNLEQR